MDYRHVTPPSDDDYPTMQCPGGSASTQASYLPHDWSPESAMTAATTPPRSPCIIRECGSRLLPKPRDQDQIIEDKSTVAGCHGHSRTASLLANAFEMQFGPAIPQYLEEYRRSASPHGRAQVPSPAPSAHGHPQPPDSAWHRPSMANMRSVSASHISSVRSHSRNASSSSIDASMLSRYGYPTYRQSPTPQPIGCGISMSPTPSAMSHLTPIAMPNGQVQSYPNGRRTASPPANPSRLSVEAELPDDTNLSTSTVLEYLTAPNPTPSLIQKITETNKLQDTHFWFDVRNIRCWSDFNIDTICTIPGLLDLLKVSVSTHHLPTPGSVNLSPESLSQLADLCTSHHALKINAALKLAQGNKHITMRTLRPGTARQPPEFIANYQSDGEKTIYGEGRGRVVGIVKSYHQWNSGYRNGSNVDKIKYLDHLAHLHRLMREHGTRYGFLLTEIELVCVRMGGPPSSSSSFSDPNVPLYGYLEIAPSVQISAHAHGTTCLRMTVGLALWYLHMLAKEQPFPGQRCWRLEVGGPAAMTRRWHVERDGWMPKVNVMDVRMARRKRGWVWPEEPLHKREGGRGRCR